MSRIAEHAEAPGWTDGARGVLSLHAHSDIRIDLW
jgi:hypothetical protein